APTHRLVDLRLPRGVGQMIVAANDMGDAHVVIVDHDGEIVGRRPVASEDDEVVEILIGEGYASLHLVVDDRLAVARRLEADRGLHPWRRVLMVAIPPRAVIAGRAP